MDFLNQIVDLLGRLGFNTTRLKWRLFQLEKRSQQKSFGVRLPASLQWLTYPHKRCRHCNGIVDREARTCPHCGKRAPTILGYKLTRLLGVAAPQGTPVTLGAFVFVIVAVYVLQIGMQGLSLILGPSNYTFVLFGAWTTATRDELWRYLAFGLGHIGVLHIAFNLFALTQVGPPIEDRIGPWRMLVLITVTQIAAAIASYVWYYTIHHANTATAGASGWLFGLIGYGIAYFGNQTGYVRDYRDQLVKWAVYSLIFGFVMGANNAAHVGGMVAGFALGKVPEPRRQIAAQVKIVWNAAAAISAALWIVTLATLGHSIVTGWSPGGKPPSRIETEQRTLNAAPGDTYTREQNPF